MPICAKCNKSIKPASLAVTIGEDSLHPTCIYCANCDQPLWGKPFKRLKDGRMTCESPCAKAAPPQLQHDQRQQHYQHQQQHQHQLNQYAHAGHSDPFDQTYHVLELNTAADINFGPTWADYQQQQHQYQQPQSKSQSQPQSQSQSQRQQTIIPVQFSAAFQQQQLQQPQPQLPPPLALPTPPQLPKLCRLCSKSVVNKRFITYENGEIYCNECDTHLNEQQQNQINKQQQQPRVKSAQSFVCSICSNVVTDKKFFTEANGRIVCENCEKTGARCENCYQLFKYNEFPRRLPNGKKYHEYCFQCDNCKKPLGKGDFYFSEDISGNNTPGSGVPVCQECVDASFNNFKCLQCTQPISGSYLMIENTKPIHNECFKCSVCSTKLDRHVGYFKSKTNPDLLLCGNCNLKQNLLASTSSNNDSGGGDAAAAVVPCAKCSKPIEVEGISFSNKNYHRECFNCDKCGVDLTTMKRTMTDPDNQHLYCEPCLVNNFSPKCSKCNQPIPPNATATKFEEKIYHKECFNCSRCKRPLNDKKFFKSGNSVICEYCFN